MIKLNSSVDNLLGKKFTFYLSNSKQAKMANEYLTYEIFSPGISTRKNGEEIYYPLLSLTKVDEGSNNLYGDPKLSLNLIQACYRSKKDVDLKEQFELVQNILKREKIDTFIFEGKEFPDLEMINGNHLQKALIAGIRDTIRKKYYRYHSGNLIDILVSPEHFILTEVTGDLKEKTLKLVPVNAYRLDDPRMQNPCSEVFNNTKLPKWVTDYSGRNVNFWDINSAIKRFEKDF